MIIMDVLSEICNCYSNNNTNSHRKGVGARKQVTVSITYTGVTTVLQYDMLGVTCSGVTTVLQ